VSGLAYPDEHNRAGAFISESDIFHELTARRSSGRCACLVYHATLRKICTRPLSLLSPCPLCPGNGHPGSYSTRMITRPIGRAAGLKPPPRVYDEKEGDKAHDDYGERHPILLDPVLPSLRRLAGLNADRDQKQNAEQP